MNPLRILLAEIAYRKLNFALSLFAVTVAVTLLVAGPILIDGYEQQTSSELKELESGVQEAAQRVTLSEQQAAAAVAKLETGVREAADRVTASEREAAATLAQLEDETRKAMLTLGFNLLILDGATEMSEYWSTGFPTRDMPEEFVQRLAKNPSLDAVTHIVGTLRAKSQWEDQTVGLAGFAPEATQSHHRKKAPMGYRVEAGTVFLGHHLAKDRKEGDTVEFMDKSFRIARILPEMGSEYDTTIFTHLSDAQQLLDKPGKVNEILALDCRCVEADLPKIRKQVSDILPECFVSRISSRALARARQREMVGETYQQTIARQKEDLAARQEHLATAAETHRQAIARQKQNLQAREKHLADTTANRESIQAAMETMAGVVTILVLLVTGIWVGLLATANVRERTCEIGVLRALGKGSGMIATLFLGKALLLGLLGGAAGLALGTATAWFLTVRLLAVPSGSFQLPISMLLTAVLGAPLLAVMASYLPTLLALKQDPAVVLRDA